MRQKDFIADAEEVYPGTKIRKSAAFKMHVDLNRIKILNANLLRGCDKKQDTCVKRACSFANKLQFFFFKSSNTVGYGYEEDSQHLQTPDKMF